MITEKFERWCINCPIEEFRKVLHNKQEQIIQMQRWFLPKQWEVRYFGITQPNKGLLTLIKQLEHMHKVHALREMLDA